MIVSITCISILSTYLSLSLIEMISNCIKFREIEKRTLKLTVVFRKVTRRTKLEREARSGFERRIRICVKKKRKTRVRSAKSRFEHQRHLQQGGTRHFFGANFQAHSSGLELASSESRATRYSRVRGTG